MIQRESSPPRILLVYIAATAAWVALSSVMLHEWPLMQQSGYVLFPALLFYLLLHSRRPAPQSSAGRLDEPHTWSAELFENNPLPMWIYDSETLGFLAVNHAACVHYGYTREEFSRMTILDLRDTADIPKLRAYISQAGPTLRHSDLWHHRRKDGSQINVEVASHSIDYQGRAARFIAVYDVTEREKFNTALQESEHKLAEILANVDAQIFIKDKEGRFLFMNRPACELLGVSLEQIIGKTDADFFAPETVEQIRKHDQRVLELGEISRREETLHNIQGGRTLTFISQKIPLRDKSGNIYGLCGVSTDITERKQTEAMLLESLRKLEQKEQAKTRFLAAAGHDLRQPIAAANLFVEALKDSDPTARQSELIARLDQSMVIFSNMLERLLDISRFDAGLVKPEFSPLDLAELQGWLEHNFLNCAADKKLALRIAFTQQPDCPTNTDIALLHSILLNLVSNAIKFTDHGHILIRNRYRHGRLVLQVWDTGIGIERTILPRIYDEFFQAGNPQRNRERGLGLGLSIAKRAVKLLGGKLICHSRPGRGTVFEVCLPPGIRTVQENAAPYDSPAIVEPDFKGSKTILIEDDALVAQGMRDLLEGMGSRVILYTNAENALFGHDVNDADYFIVDYMLEGQMNGVQFLRLMREKLGRPMRAVLITGDTTSATLQMANNFSWPVLSKPLNKTKLMAALGSTYSDYRSGLQ